MENDALRHVQNDALRHVQNDALRYVQNDALRYVQNDALFCNEATIHGGFISQYQIVFRSFQSVL